MIPSVEWYTKTKNIHHLRVGREESIMNSPNSTSDSSWNQAGVPSAPATDVTDEAGMDPGSILPPETRLRGIDIQTPETIDNTLARPVQIHPTYFAPTRVMSPTTMIGNTMIGALGNDQVNSVNEINVSLLLGQHLCQVCSEIGPEMMVCAECGMVGHPLCCLLYTSPSPRD